MDTLEQDWNFAESILTDHVLLSKVFRHVRDDLRWCVISHDGNFVVSRSQDEAETTAQQLGFPEGEYLVMHSSDLTDEDREVAIGLAGSMLYSE